MQADDDPAGVRDDDDDEVAQSDNNSDSTPDAGEIDDSSDEGYHPSDSSVASEPINTQRRRRRQKTKTKKSAKAKAKPPEKATTATNDEENRGRTRYNLRRNRAKKQDEDYVFTHVARVQLKAGLTFLNNGRKRKHTQSFKSMAAAHLSSKHEEHVVFNQMSWKSGLKKH